MKRTPLYYNRQYNANNKMRIAIELRLKGETWHKITLKTGIPYISLIRYYALYKADNEIFNKNQKKLEDKYLIADRKVAEVFNPDVVNALRECLKEFNELFYGLSDKEYRMLAYQIAVRNACKIPHDWNQNKMVSAEFIQYFKIKNHDLNVERPDRCSMRLWRSVLWIKRNVTKFYDTLEELVNSNPVFLTSARIYNLDEMYVSMDPFLNKFSRESRGDIITLCCIVSASGTSLPLIKVISPNTIVNRSPKAPGAICITGHGGQMTPQIFPLALQHFVKYSNSSLQNPSILIMDTDWSHLSLAAFEWAKASGVHFITVHPHMSKQVQPLVAVLFDLFRAHYQECIDSCIKEYDGGDFINLCKLADETYVKVMTPDHITNAFKKCGIVPFDRDLYTDDDYQTFEGIDLPCSDCRARTAASNNINKPVAEDPVDILDESASGTSKDPEESSTELTDSSQTLDEIQKTQIDGPKMTSKQRGAEELDKLKRRMIRTVARLLKEKKTEEEVWEQLKKESGSNCKNLWDRMRSLTMKKLKRLLDADDRIELVPAVARMTLTDWLLYDLVIVHEKIDVINRYDTTNTRPVLNNLFSLVQLFSIEDRHGDDLAEAWTAATVYYNSKGHQCSPMLMQRRWYQIKEMTRHKMYKFWFNYRGNQRLLEVAKQDSPSELHKAIALKYPQIITQPFPEWEERIETRLVIMPEEFEVKMRKKVLMKPSDENAPDVVIVEQKIDTIEIDGDTDSEYSDEGNSRESAENTTTTIDTDSQTPVTVQVKTEPQDDDDIDTIEHSPYQLQEPRDRFLDEIERLKMEEDKILSDEDETAEDIAPDFLNDNQDVTMPLITSVQGGVDIEKKNTVQHDSSLADTELQIEDIPVVEQSIVIEDDDDEDEYIIPSIDIPQAENRNTQATNLIENNISQPTTVDEDTKYDIITNIEPSVPIEERMVIDKPEVQNEVNLITSAIENRFKVETKMDIDDIEVSLHYEDNPVENTVVDKESVQDIPVSQDVDLGDEILSDLNFADDGMEFADDGIEYFEHNEDQYKSKDTPEEQQKDGNESGSKFDLKLLMSPVVYTTKLDKMTVYKNRPLFDTVDSKELVDKIILESKPTSARSINVKSEKNDKLPTEVDNYDTKEIDDEFFQNDSVDEDDKSDIIDESKRIKLSSNLLQKPRTRSYNPIQLCKNPDFNTRLKWLTVGFFSSTRNRVLLKACKPMTIDLSKAFESKLVDGTMYLKPSDQLIKIENDDKVNESTVSIAPSAVAVQSLMDTTDVDRILQEELKKRMLERSKTINLPNINVVRKINQQLLSLEVAPMLAQVQKSALGGNTQTENVVSLNDGAKRLKLNPVVEINEDSDESDNNSYTKDNHAPNVVSHTKLNEAMNTQVGPQTKNPEPADESAKSKSDRVLEIQKKIKARQNHLPTWLAKSNVLYDSTYNSLLTIDTLYKMLNALNPCQEYACKLNPKKKKTIPYNKQLYNAASAKLQPGNPSENQTKQSVQPQDAATATPKVTKVNTPGINTKNGKRKRCCWAMFKKSKITGTNDIRGKLGPHKCPPGACICCCREELRQAELDIAAALIKLTAKHNKPTESTEKAVVQIQSSDTSDINNMDHQPAVRLVNVDPNAANAFLLNSGKISADASVQIDMEESDTVQVVNNAPEVLSSTEGMEADDVTIDLNDDTDEDNNVDVSEPPSSEKCPSPRLRVYASRGRRPTPLVSNRHINAVLKKDIRKKTQPLSSVQSSAELAIGSKIGTVELNSKNPRKDPIPCTCRPNVAVDETSATLLIDGTSNCLRHAKSRVSKETRIYLNRRHMSLTERPFYIAKNKILLTNIKPPRPPTPPPPPPVNVPDGVQIVLLPDGTITYLVEPNVELTPEQLAAMPPILLAIQQQIKASGVTLPVESTDAIQNLIKSNVDGKETQSNDGTCKPSAPSASIPKSESDLQNEASTNPNLKNNNANNKEPSIAISDSSPTAGEDSNMTSYVVGESCFQNEVNQGLSSNEVNTELETVKNANVADGSLLIGNEVAATQQHIDLDTIENPPTESLTNVGADAVNENEANKGEVGSDNAATSSSRNLLSDLMEMSGIMEEDIAPVPQESSTASLLPPEYTTQPLEVSVVPGPPSTSSVSASVPGLSPLGKRKHTISAQIDEKVHELNPITSFAELKYACDHNGLFFKLDLSSGIIAPINVCIQKNTSDISNRPVGTKFTEVIDLTDEKLVPTQRQSKARNGKAVPTQERSKATNAKPIPTQEQYKVTIAKPIRTQEQYMVTIAKPIPTEEQSKATTDAPSKKTTTAKSVSNMSRKLSTMLPTKAPKPVGSGLKTAQYSKNSILIKSPEVPSAISILERKKQELLNKLSNNLKPLQILHHRQQNINILRKSIITPPKAPINRRLLNLNKVETRIDLIDSDEPMEEEYLVDNTSDDSDDEPLANLAIKKKSLSADSSGARNSLESEEDPGNTQGSLDAQESVSQDGSLSQDGALSQDGTLSQDELLSQEEPVDQGKTLALSSIDFEAAIDSVEVPVPVSQHPAASVVNNPVATYLVLSGDAINQQIPLNAEYLASLEADNEDSQEDCILGV